MRECEFEWFDGDDWHYCTGDPDWHPNCHICSCGTIADAEALKLQSLPA